MPTITFVAPIIRAAIATLEENLPTQIGLFNAEEANEVTLAEPSAYVFGAMDPLLLTSGPVIEVAAVAGSLGPGAIGRADIDHDPALNVVVWHEGERGELGPTYEMSLGLLRCVIEVLCEPGAFGEDAEIPDEEGAITWRTDALPADPTEDARDFRKWHVPALATFRVEAVERF